MEALKAADEMRETGSIGGVLTTRSLAMGRESTFMTVVVWEEVGTRLNLDRMYDRALFASRVHVCLNCFSLRNQNQSLNSVFTSSERLVLCM